VTADVRKNIFSPVGHSKNHHTFLCGFSRFTPRVKRPNHSGNDFPRIYCSGVNFAEIYSLPSKRGFGSIPPFAITPTLKKYFSIRCLFHKSSESEPFTKFFPAGAGSVNKQNTRTMRSTEWLPASRLQLGLVPRPAGVAPRAAIGDRGRSQKYIFSRGSLQKSTSGDIRYFQIHAQDKSAQTERA
jgi:hypothetical protein